MCLCFAYVCQVAGQSHWNDGLEEALRAAADRLFPGAQWAGLYADAYYSCRLSLDCRPTGFVLNQRLRRGDVLLVAEAFQAFRRVRDLRRILNAFEWQGFRLVALDVDMTDDDAIESWCQSLHRRRSAEAVADARARDFAIGPAPMGFKLVGPPGRRKIVPDAYQLTMMQEATKLFGQGLSRYQVARRMMLNGWVSPRTGREWSEDTCKRARKAYLELVRKGVLRPLPDVQMSGV
jgi:hypothetical protein